MNELSPRAPRPASLPSLTTIAPALMQMGLGDDNGIISDMRKVANLISPTFSQGQRIEHMMSQGAFIWRDPNDTGVLTPESFVVARRRFLTAFREGLKSPDLQDSDKFAGELMLGATVLRELSERLKGNSVGYIEHADPSAYITTDGKPATEHHGPATIFHAMGALTLPNDIRYTLLPEHLEILSALPEKLRSMRTLIEAEVKRFADEDPDDLREETVQRLDAAKRLLLKMNSGLSFPGFSSGAASLPGH